MKKKISKLHCYRCGHKWIPHKPYGEIMLCSKCKSAFWEIPLYQMEQCRTQFLATFKNSGKWLPPEMLKLRENRKYPRFVLRQEIWWIKGSGSIRDISLGGCFVETKKHENNTFNISFVLPQTMRVVNALCEVRWSNNGGIGSRFILDRRNKKILSEWFLVRELEKK